LFGALGVGLVGGGIAWGVRQHAASAQMAQIETLRQQAFAEELPETERRELREKLRDEIRKLPEAERDRLWQQGREQFRSQMQERIQEVLALPPAERTAALDKQINEFEKRRKERDSRRSERGSERDRPGPGAPSAGGAGAANGATAGTQGASNQPAGGRNPQDPNARRRRMLDNTTPQQRAQMAEYRRLMNERRKERGLPPISRRGF
jgi:hypothetical protein